MELPAQLRSAIDRELEGLSLSYLRAASDRLTARYRAETRDGRLHLDGLLAVKAYLAARMPATYAAIRSALEATAGRLDKFAPTTLLDVGAGPGTALWAVRDCWPQLQSATLVETSESARHVGSVLAQQMSDVGVQWEAGDAAIALARCKPADLVTLAYVLDELEPATRTALVDRLWQLTGQALVIVEPGTPAGWGRIIAARQQLIQLGAAIAAPCPHQFSCPLALPDWCHFSRRVARSKLHRLTKSGDAPFEDEKFIYLAAARAVVDARGSRVLAPPRHSKIGIDLKLCQPGGTVSQTFVPKRETGRYRIAKRLDWGDAFES